jgi:inner membrane protein
LSAVLVAGAVWPNAKRQQLAVVAVAGAFPDLDYALFLFDPLTFLNLHRGPTHSLLLMPLWALLLAWPASKLSGLPRSACMVLCTLGIFVHILGDWVTLYGTQLFFPLSDRAYALRASFDINPWIALVAVIGALFATRLDVRRTALISLSLIAALLAAQFLLGRQALATAVDYAGRFDPMQLRVQVFPQPLSPFHWALVVEHAGGYEMAYLDQLGLSTAVAIPSEGLQRMVVAYRAAQELDWRHHERPTSAALTGEAWRSPALQPYRRFADVPALLRVDQTLDATCVWFTDLRHLLPGPPASFRYGACRAHDADDWRPYRLRHLTQARAQAL